VKEGSCSRPEKTILVGDRVIAVLGKDGGIYLQHDHLGSVTRITDKKGDVLKDDKGEVVGLIDYSPFGASRASGMNLGILVRYMTKRRGFITSTIKVNRFSKKGVLSHNTHRPV